MCVGECWECVLPVAVSGATLHALGGAETATMFELDCGMHLIAVHMYYVSLLVLGVCLFSLSCASKLTLFLKEKLKTHFLKKQIHSEILT